jgi:hypothetical protein
MKIHIIEPFALDKNLGRAYNEACALVPDMDWVCLKDVDCMFLLPDQVNMMYEYAIQNPDCLLSCYVNRIHHLSPQLFNGTLSMNFNVKIHIEIAEQLRFRAYKTRRVNKPISGVLLLFPKSLWLIYKFSEDMLCLGVDSTWTAGLLDAGVNIFMMESIYLFHIYRIQQGVNNKSHLL